MSNHANILRNLSAHEVFILISVIVGTWALLKLNKIVFKYIAKETTASTRYRLMSIQPVIRLVILFGSFFWILSLIIVPSGQNIITILGAAGLAIGFAFREYISSMIAGIVSLYEAPYRPGDWIEIDEFYGEVTSIGLRYVEIITPDNVNVRIPQKKFWNSAINNYNYGSTYLMCVTKFYLRPNQDVDPKEIYDILYDVALSSSYTNVKRPVIITMSDHLHGFIFKIKSFPRDPRDQFRYKTDLTIKATQALQNENIELSEFQ